MDSFRNAKAVRLISAHGKYLTADEDEESVVQDRNGSSKPARWAVEFVPNSDDSLIRLKSCYGKYLTASNQPFLLGMTGHKVLQTLPPRPDSSVEWEPIKGHGGVKLRTRYGQFLRANGALPPWRNSVTHNIPHRTMTQEWILWDVHMVEIATAQSPAAKPPPPLVIDSLSSDSRTASSKSAGLSRQESKDSSVGSSPLPNVAEGRKVYFSIADEKGEVEQGFDEMSISFRGSNVSELTTSLEMELGVSGLTVCTKSPLNGRLYPLRLQLPPNNAAIHVVILPAYAATSSSLYVV